MDPRWRGDWYEKALTDSLAENGPGRDLISNSMGRVSTAR